MSEGSEAKKYVWIGIGLVLLFGPLILLSDWGLQKVQGYVNDNQGEPWAGEWEDHIATAYSWTGRHERAKAAYEFAYNLFTSRSDTEHAIQALYAEALEIEELPNGKYEALPVYDKIAATWPTHELGIKSRGATQRIRLMSRP